MRPSRTWSPLVHVALAALLVSCGGGSAPPAASGPTGSTSSPARSSTGPGAGPPVPTAPPYAEVTPGVVTTVDGAQQVVVSGFDRFFDPGVIRIHPGKLRVILRNDDQIEPHNLVFQGSVKGRTPDALPRQATDVTVILNKPGLYDFLCTFHELVGMRGQVKVE